MRFVVQRVAESEVKVDGEVLGKIGKGFMVLSVLAIQIQKKLLIK